MNDWFESEKHVERAQELYESGRLDDALRELRAALRLNPYQGECHYGLGMVFDAMGRNREAIRHFEQALELQGEDIELLNSVGVACMRASRLSEAEHYFQRAERLDSRDEASYSHRIALYTQLGDHDQAELMFYLAIQIDDGAARAYFNLAESLLDRRKADRAIWCLEQVLRLDPSDGEVHARLGEAYHMKGAHERAHACYLEQLRTSGGDVDTLLDLGNLLVEMDRNAEASEKFRHVIELAPDNADAHFYLGVLALRSAHLDAAQLSLEKSLRLNGKRGETRQKLAYVHLKRDRLTDARAYLHDELKLRAYRNDPRAAEELGQLCLEAHLPRKAARVFLELIREEGPDVQLCHEAAVALFMCGRMEDGVRYCRKALRADREFVPALHNLALANWRLGRLRRARYWAKRALDASPSDRRLQQLALRLWFARNRELAVRFYRRLLNPR